MNGFKRLILTSAITSVSVGAQAQLKVLDDLTLGKLTGQAGLTIDVETSYTLGEFQYKDAGSVFLTGLSLGGNTSADEIAFATATGNASTVGGSYLDNYRIYIDIAGDGSTTDTAGNADNNLNYGFSRISDFAAVHVAAGNGDLDISAAALATLSSGALASTDKQGNAMDGRRNYDDGDLVIHFSFTDAWQKGGGFGAYATGLSCGVYSVPSFGFGPCNNFNIANLGVGTTSLASVTYDEAVDLGTRAVDFNFNIDAIGIADSAFVTGETIGADLFEHKATGTDSDTTTTVLISELSINGYLGPADLVIENNGNGFSGGPTGPGTGDADSKITWGSYFRITDLDIYIDIAGVYLKDVEIKNTRGDLTGLDNTGSFGFAHSIRQIYAVKDAVLDVGGKNGGALGTNTGNFVDGLALNTRFKGDIDIGAIEFGDTNVSIGSLFLTDMESDTKWTISAH